MKKLRITTNQGKIFDFFLNLYLNLGLWWKGIDDVDRAVEFSARKINRIKKYL